ncbi:MAG: 30S ribosomal protein S12 methylthiotransferase RimO [Gemmatimonadales bacterium]
MRSATRGSRSLPVFPISPTPVRPGVAADVVATPHDFAPVGDARGVRVALVTLGCDKNTVDSERLLATLVGQGARISPEVEGADVVIVNTCGFIQEAKEQSIETILEACEAKATRGGPSAVVAVGCLVERHAAELAAEIPEVDLFLGLSDLPRLVPELRRRGFLTAHDDDVPLMERPLRVLSTATPHTSYLKISEGCDHTCAFCAIPLMRGLHRSHPVEELVREAAGLGAAGVKELNVVSQDTTWYGRDLRRHDPKAPLLPDLLRALLAGTDVPWFRLFYMYPSGITREVVELLASEPRILPYLDMPIQHGGDRILALMRRPERRATILERVAWLREAVPDLTLRTTVIVGFPGETDADFRELLDLLDEVGFDRVGAFAYSLEEGTRAAELPDQVPEGLARERLEELMDLQRVISFEKNEAAIGRTAEAIVDERVTDDGEYVAVARTRGQALDIDGVTHLRAPADVDPGRMVEVHIVDALDYDLVAEVRTA